MHDNEPDCGATVNVQHATSAKQRLARHATFRVPFRCNLSRFVVKGWRKRRTVYAVTDELVLVAVGARYVADAPVAGLSVTTRLSRDAQHANVILGPNGTMSWDADHVREHRPGPPAAPSQISAGR